MPLSRKQLEFKQKIVEGIENSKTSIVHLHGPLGGGKTEIIKSCLKELRTNYENWAAFYIEGKLGLNDPYSTITLSEDVNHPYLEHNNFGFNFGFKIFEFINLGLTNSFKKKEVFDSKINFFAKKIAHLAEENILIIADSYHFWDKSSQSFLEALRHSKKTLKDKKVKIIIITDDEEKQSSYLNSKMLFTEGLNIYLELPKIDEIGEMLKVLGYKLSLSRHDLENIMSLSGANIDFIKIVVEGLYLNKLTNVVTDQANLDLKVLLECRLDLLGDKKLDYSDILKASSIITGDFSTKEISFLCKEKTNIDEILNNCCENLLLKKGNQYVFSNSFIQDFFYMKLHGTHSRFHLQYYNFLKENKPEDYLTRAIHLSLGDIEGIHTQEIVGLFILAYCRNIFVASQPGDCDYIEKALRKTIKNSDNYNMKVYLRTFNNMIDACKSYLEEDYSYAYEKLKSISDTGSLLLKSEVARMELLVSLMLDMNTDRIKSHVQKLDFLLRELEVNEKEEWAICSFVLFSTYSNKLGDFDKTEQLALKLLTFITNNQHNKFFEYLGKVVQRKAFLYKSPVMSEVAIEDAVIYFEQSSDYLQYYFSLCNLAGILMVLSKFDKALSHLDGCLHLISDHKYINFPSKEKIYNNLYLTRFLSHLRREDFEISHPIVDETIVNLKSQISMKPSEKDAIMLLNLANIFLMKKDFHNCNKVVDDLRKYILIANEDRFYEYYIKNIYLVIEILNKNWETSKQYLADFKQCVPEYHRKIQKQLTNRVLALDNLISRKLDLDPVALDRWVYEQSSPMEAACSFYCRLFLFSDLQFSSL
ncbi:hypothetical protein KDC22_08365 [Paenibacillus tritici]|uniref:hypothetical protein n=1 Tax=Paenibacillus tritici TaxID=1873425 RepID=UPI001BAC75E2|nr:hypothetical protein [Paenibacillus tritici]QUL56494.1 hypothetical protein KDC22_08365 [Paenibacillus tritici]